MSNSIKFVFDFNWRLSFCVLAVFPALISLSLWQVDRAKEKIELKKNWQLQQAAEPAEFDPNAEYSDNRRVLLTGVYLSDVYWLKENQFHNSVLGYHVIMPFQLESGAVIIVNRGWVRGSASRDFMPEVMTPMAKQNISGILTFPTDSKLIEEVVGDVKIWPHKILEVDLSVMGQQIEGLFHSKILRIDADSPSALIVRWRPINISPAKHYGYAVQWFLLAVALLILYVFASTNISQFLKGKKKR